MSPGARGVVVLVAGLLTAALTARLGIWQLDRAAQKVHLQQAIEAQQALPPLPLADLARNPASAVAQQHRRVLLQGRWQHGRTIYLDNRQMDTRQGFFAVTPLSLDDGSAVLVQRGWLPRDQADRTHIVAPAPPQGRIELLGRVEPGLGRVYEFAGAASGPIRQNLDINAYAQESALALRPVAVVQLEEPGTSTSDGLLRHWPAPAADVHKHYGYAFQWFALSALILVLYAWFQIIRPYRHRQLRH